MCYVRQDGRRREGAAKLVSDNGCLSDDGAKVSHQPTIFALSSGSGSSGVAVIRISGPAVAATITLLRIGPLPPRVARLVQLIDPATGEAIDSALALFFPAPRSYTGEDVLELHVHGGRAVVGAALGALSRIDGLRLAEAGEFTRRAFHHGKMDLTEAEGLSDLIAAETEAQRRQALQVAGGNLRHLYEGWRQELIEAMALVEAAIDFSDEADVATDAVVQARRRVINLRARIAAHLDDKQRGEILRDGFRVVIAGPPNVGKSSLLNALARRDVAIVSPEPGTTRDVIEARLDLGGYPVMISDTAGFRDNPGGDIEREGIRRSYARSAEADLVLWLADSTATMLEPSQELLDQGVDLIRLYSKADLASDQDLAPAAISFSARTGKGMPQLIDLLTQAARTRLDPGDAPLITTARQRALVTESADRLDDFLTGAPNDVELRAEDLRRSAHALGRLTGRIDVEDVLDQVFSAFCIGK